VCGEREGEKREREKERAREQERARESERERERERERCVKRDLETGLVGSKRDLRVLLDVLDSVIQFPVR